MRNLPVEKNNRKNRPVHHAVRREAWPRSGALHGDVQLVLEEFGASPEGLAEGKVKQRIEQFGPNTVVHAKPAGWWSLLLRAFNNAFVFLAARPSGPSNSPEKQSLFQTAWFVEGLLSQTLIVHIIRTRRVPFLQSRASGALLATTGLVVAAGVAIPFTALGGSLGMQPLPGRYFPWLVLILICYGVLGQWMKRWYDRRFGFYE